MRTLVFSLAMLVTALMITACASRNPSQRLSEDESFRRKLIGEWSGSMSVSSNEMSTYRSIIRSDGSFSAWMNINDTSGHLLRAAQWGGTFVVTNRAVACTITTSGEGEVSPPRKIPPEPIVRLDDRELVIINEHGQRVVSRKVSFVGARAGEERKLGGVDLCWCPPGRFRMGSQPDEPGHRADEEQVEVALSRGFWMGKHEVTQGQWRRVAGALPGVQNADVGEDFPVYSVSFIEAEGFCRMLTEQARASGELPADWEFRLPTEAQWEYACRAGSTTAFSFGNTLTIAAATFGKPYNGTPTGVPGSASSKAGSHAANAWGLHDMHGNEWEWCRDWYHARLPGGVDPDLSAMKGLPNGDGTFSRVRRGGAWVESADFCRSAVRLRYEPERRADHIGFRIIAFRP
jgi:formylglycine-generating enzyme required for sulfatase activity